MQRDATLLSRYLILELTHVVIWIVALVSWGLITPEPVSRLFQNVEERLKNDQDGQIEERDKKVKKAEEITQRLL